MINNSIDTGLIKHITSGKQYDKLLSNFSFSGSIKKNTFPIISTEVSTFPIISTEVSGRTNQIKFGFTNKIRKAIIFENDPFSKMIKIKGRKLSFKLPTNFIYSKDRQFIFIAYPASKERVVNHKSDLSKLLDKKGILDSLKDVAKRIFCSKSKQEIEVFMMPAYAYNAMTMSNTGRDLYIDKAERAKVITLDF